MLDIKNLPEIIVAPRTDPLYSCHSYLTKVPIDAIKPFVENFTKPGQTVLDFFAGSGMTGLAALSLNRKAFLSDISILGKHIADGFLTNVFSEDMREAADGVIARAKNSIGTIYTTTRSSDKNKVELVRTIWSFVYICPSCNSELVYYEHVSKTGKVPNECPTCNSNFARRSWPRGKDVPVQVVISGVDGRQIEQKISDYDIRNIRKAIKDIRQDQIPSLSIDRDREMYSRSGLGKSGMTETKMFFSPRNSIALLELWREINALSDEKIRQKLRFAFTAILPRASKRYQWSAKRPLNAQNQTYYIAPVYYEWNIFDLFNRKVNATIRANDLLFSNRNLWSNKIVQDITYETSSADKLKHIKDASVDYIFTDPPFGSNIFYSDMNLFHEAWLGKTTDYKSEAVIHTTGKRKDGSDERYEMLLQKAFQEAFRTLKPGCYMSVVFGNSRGSVWGLVQRALRNAGFKSSPVHVAILDKGQRSVKGLNSGSQSVVTVDLILTYKKPKTGKKANNVRRLVNGDTSALINGVIERLPDGEAKNASHVYAQVLKEAILKNLELDELHLSDVLIALSNMGYSINRKTGLLYFES